MNKALLIWLGSSIGGGLMIIFVIVCSVVACQAHFLSTHQHLMAVMTP